MGASPQFKIYNKKGEYIASTKYADDAAVLVAARGSGTVRIGHSKKDILYDEEIDFTDSYDKSAILILERLKHSFFNLFT